MKNTYLNVLAGAALAVVGSGVIAAAPAQAAESTAIQAGSATIQLHTGDAFTTSQHGVLCEVGSAGLVCGFEDAVPYKITAADAKRLCGQAALQSVTINSRGWKWGCGTGVVVVPTAASNAWATPYTFATDARLKAPVVPANTTFYAGGARCHVTPTGELSCFSTKSTTGFLATNKYVYLLTYVAPTTTAPAAPGTSAPASGPAVITDGPISSDDGSNGSLIAGGAVALVGVGIGGAALRRRVRR